MTGQSILDLMEVINAELQLQSGESDVTRALRALNAAQDHFEARLANTPEVLGDSYGTVTATAATETTSFPTGVLRVDRCQLLNSDGLPISDVVPLAQMGDQATQRRWPWNLLLPTAGQGSPTGFATKGQTIFWQPVPDQTYSVRWYGLQRADDIAAASTFAYPDEVALPLAAFANRLLKEGWDDQTVPLDQIVASTFDPVIDGLANRNPDGARPLVYRYFHEA